MTREEALIQLRLGPGINEDVSEEYNEAVDIAIKAIRTIPSEEEKVIRISKGTLKARTGRYVIYDVEWLKEHFNTTEAKIYGQPNEELQQKTGHWIEHKHGGIEHIECSECGIWFLREDLPRNSYCPNCGSRNHWAFELKLEDGGKRENG